MEQDTKIKILVVAGPESAGTGAGTLSGTAGRGSLYH